MDQPHLTLAPADDALHEGCTMGDLIVRAIQRGGDRVAFAIDDRSITWREFGARLGRLVRALEARGLTRGDPVATLSANSPEAFMVTAAYLMGLRITWMHPMASEDDHACLLEDSGVRTLFVDPAAFGPRAAALRARLPGLERVDGLGPLDGAEDILAAGDGTAAPPLRQDARAFRHGWLCTGDLARSDEDGFLCIVDRSKDMVISGGFNVFPREIEDVLTRHPAVAAAAVLGVPDATWGEAVKAVAALRPDAAASAEELIAMVRDAKGPVYAPKSVDFVDSLPVTGLGKPDKKVLRARYWGGQQRAVH